MGELAASLPAIAALGRTMIDSDENRFEAIWAIQRLPGMAITRAGTPSWAVHACSSWANLINGRDYPEPARTATHLASTHPNHPRYWVERAVQVAPSSQ